MSGDWEGRDGLIRDLSSEHETEYDGESHGCIAGTLYISPLQIIHNGTAIRIPAIVYTRYSSILIVKSHTLTVPSKDL